MTSGFEKGDRVPEQPDEVGAGTTSRGTRGVPVRVASAGGGTTLVCLGAMFDRTTVIVCAVLAAVVWLAAVAIPQRSEDRLHLWLGLVAKPAPRGDAKSSQDAPSPSRSRQGDANEDHAGPPHPGSGWSHAPLEGPSLGGPRPPGLMIDCRW